MTVLQFEALAIRKNKFLTSNEMEKPKQAFASSTCRACSSTRRLTLQTWPPQRARLPEPSAGRWGSPARGSEQHSAAGGCPQSSPLSSRLFITGYLQRRPHPANGIPWHLRAGVGRLWPACRIEPARCFCKVSLGSGDTHSFSQLCWKREHWNCTTEKSWPTGPWPKILSHGLYRKVLQAFP